MGVALRNAVSGQRTARGLLPNRTDCLDLQASPSRVSYTSKATRCNKDVGAADGIPSLDSIVRGCFTCTKNVVIAGLACKLALLGSGSAREQRNPRRRALSRRPRPAAYRSRRPPELRGRTIRRGCRCRGPRTSRPGRLRLEGKRPQRVLRLPGP